MTNTIHRRDVLMLQRGDKLHTTNWGLIEFRRWDDYMGERTAEIRSIEFGDVCNPFPCQLQEAHDAWVKAQTEAAAGVTPAAPLSARPSRVTVLPRRPLMNAFPDGYRESDRDYVDNNLEAAVALLDAAQAASQPQTVKPAALAPGFYWYLRKGAAATVVEKRADEGFVRRTDGAHQTWLGDGEAFIGPLQAPTLEPLSASLA